MNFEWTELERTRAINDTNKDFAEASRANTVKTKNIPNEMTHTIDIIISNNYPHEIKQRAMVSLSGDGSLDHIIEAFKIALVAAGFSMDTAKKLDEINI